MARAGSASKRASLRLSFKGDGVLRDSKGRFASGNNRALINELTVFNKELARRVQAQVVKNLHATYVRPNVSTGRLEKATADPENIYADEFGWGVGVPEFLDNSIAKYWRTIEEGSVATWRRGGMAGMVIHGFWGGTISGYYMQANAYSAPSPTLAPRAAGPWGRAAVGGKLNGIFAETAARMGLPGMTITREIQPHRFYANAVSEIDPFRITAEQAIKVLTDYVRMTLRGS